MACLSATGDVAKSAREPHPLNIVSSCMLLVELAALVERLDWHFVVLLHSKSIVSVLTRSDVLPH